MSLCASSVSGNLGPESVRRTGQLEQLHWPLGHAQLPVLVHPQSGIMIVGVMVWL